MHEYAAARPGAGPWTITSAARRMLVAESERLAAEIARSTTFAATGSGFPIGLPLRDSARRLETMRTVLAASVACDEPGIAAIGRLVTLRDGVTGGRVGTYSLVLPGDGDPVRGWIAIDAPLGSAVIGRHVGERTVVIAPGGAWTVTVAAVRDAPFPLPQR